MAYAPHGLLRGTKQMDLQRPEKKEAGLPRDYMQAVSLTRRSCKVKRRGQSAFASAGSGGARRCTAESRPAPTVSFSPPKTTPFPKGHEHFYKAGI